MNVLLWLAVVFIIHLTGTFLKGFKGTPRKHRVMVFYNLIMRFNSQLSYSLHISTISLALIKEGFGTLGTADREELDLFHSKRPAWQRKFKAQMAQNISKSTESTEQSKFDWIPSLDLYSAVDWQPLCASQIFGEILLSSPMIPSTPSPS